MKVVNEIHTKTIENFLKPCFNVKNIKKRINQQTSVEKVCSNKGLVYNRQDSAVVTKNNENRSLLGNFSHFSELNETKLKEIAE
jgi:heterodisulfide reductase subunit B